MTLIIVPWFVLVLVISFLLGGICINVLKSRYRDLMLGFIISIICSYISINELGIKINL